MPKKKRLIPMGARRKPGPKPKPRSQKKIPISTKVSAWVYDWLKWRRKQGDTIATIIEDAVIKQHKLEKPDGLSK